MQIVEADLKPDIIKEEEHQNSIAFCHNCNQHICTLCYTNYNEHYITHLYELDEALCSSLIDEYNSFLILIICSICKSILIKTPFFKKNKFRHYFQRMKLSYKN